jgi:5-(carboxyamino)imidazole ribonucleotide mutase
MPGGIPVATMAINQAKNAALLAIRILGAHDEIIAAKLEQYHQQMCNSVLESKL